MFFGRDFGLIAWAAVGISVIVLALVKTKKLRWMAWFSLALGSIYSVANLYAWGHLPAATATRTIATTQLAASAEAIPEATSGALDSAQDQTLSSSDLGITADEFVAGWNDLAAQARVGPLVLRDSDVIYMFSGKDFYEHRFEQFDTTLSGFYDTESEVLRSAGIHAEVDYSTTKGALAAQILWDHTCLVLDVWAGNSLETDCLEELAAGLGLGFETVEGVEVVNFAGWEPGTFSSVERAGLTWQVSTWDWGVWISVSR
jgi:hypothetical protein